MPAKIYSCSFTGLQCRIIEVQADITSGLPNFAIVGLGDVSVQESKERIRSSIKNSGMIFPPTRKTVNMAPAQLKKQGALFDLPIAVSLLVASLQVAPAPLYHSVLIGELSLDGRIRPVRGILPIVQHAKEKGFKKIFIPKTNSEEASFVSGIEIYPLTSLAELIEYCSGTKTLQPIPHRSFNSLHKEKPQHDYYLFTKIIGLEKAKRALTICAAGHHNLLMTGSPGCGKTVLARSMRALLTDMTEEEIMETTKIFSVSGLLSEENPAIVNRPFREVHHTASRASIVGGGAINPKPGEISLSHNGILFLDEIAEFERNTLDALRQPLEDRYVNISRANFSVRFPCNFVLVGAMNPCPCGYKHDKKITCVCTDTQIKNYQKKISGPLLDRFDIFLEMEKAPIEQVLKARDLSKEELLLTAFKSIKNAEFMQKERFKNHKNIRKNSDMDIEEIRKYCTPDEDGQAILKQAISRYNLSNRGYLRILKIARTIADMEKSRQVLLPHVAEALNYRRQF